jgi:enamine deaminase RidA (YjgF/YER057c/UK114 family)
MFSRLAMKAAGTSSQRSIRQLSSIKRMGLDNPNMSQTVVHNGVVYLSGQVDASASNIEGQTKDILSKIDSLLQEAGTDKSKLLSASVWVKDIQKDFQGMNGVWNQWLDPNNKPVRATVEANLATSDILVEIQVIAAQTLNE